MKLPKIKKHEGKFVKNTVMLYLLQFSSYFFNIITVPYQTRVLGADCYGYIGVATALMLYFYLTLDFGFIYSATEDVAKNSNDKKRLGDIYSTVSIAKIGLTAASFLLLMAICFFIPKYQGRISLYVLYFIATALSSFLPDFIYRGLEMMEEITYRTVAVRALFTLLVFVFVKKPDDYILIPILLGIGNLIAVIWANLHIRIKLGIVFRKVSLSEVVQSLKKSSRCFLPEISTTIYTATNTVILGASSRISDTMIGFYTAADKLLITGRNALSPLSDSAYPYMVKHRDFKLIRKILLIFEPIIIVGCAIIYIIADPLCGLFFGSEYITAGSAEVYCTTGDIIRAMLPIAIFTLPNCLLGFPTLGAMGLNKQINISVIIGTVIHVANLLILYGFGMINVISLALMTSVTEGAMLLYKIIVILKHKSALSKKPE